MTAVFVPAIVTIVPLVVAAFLTPPWMPLVARQVLLCAWGVGAAIVAERLFFNGNVASSVRALGFRRPRTRIVIAALLMSVPMWLYLPLAARAQGFAVSLRPDWLLLLIGVVLVNGLAEEVIHRGFVFRHLRQTRSFAAAATLSAALFGAQHIYIGVTNGWTVGIASVVLAVLLSYPLALAFERGDSIAGPAILHTSSNAPVFVFALPESFVASALLPHMAVILASLYVWFFSQVWRRDEGLREVLRHL